MSSTGNTGNPSEGGKDEVKVKLGGRPGNSLVEGPGTGWALYTNAACSDASVIKYCAARMSMNFIFRYDLREGVY